MDNTNTQDYMLSTIDNPYNPYLDWDKWYSFDEANGYCSCGYIDRIANYSLDLTNSEQTDIILQAINEICQENINGMYIKVYKLTDRGAKET